MGQIERELFASLLSVGKSFWKSGMNEFMPDDRYLRIMYFQTLLIQFTQKSFQRKLHKSLYVCFSRISAVYEISMRVLQQTYIFSSLLVIEVAKKMTCDIWDSCRVQNLELYQSPQPAVSIAIRMYPFKIHVSDYRFDNSPCDIVTLHMT